MYYIYSERFTVKFSELAESRPNVHNVVIYDTYTYIYLDRNAEDLALTQLECDQLMR